MSGSLMADPSRKPTFSQYDVKPVCGGCDRKLIAKNEASLWFTGIPKKEVYGSCCYKIASERRAA